MKNEKQKFKIGDFVKVDALLIPHDLDEGGRLFCSQVTARRLEIPEGPIYKYGIVIEADNVLVRVACTNKSLWWHHRESVELVARAE